MLKIVIVGAGPAGVRAAERLVQAGLRPTIVDENGVAGGQTTEGRLPSCGESRRTHTALKRVAPETCMALLTSSRGVSTIDRIRRSGQPRAGDWNLVGPNGADHLIWDQLILATGAMDRVIPIPGWDMPGVFTLGGAQIALKYQACAIGTRPVFSGTGPLLYLVAYQYMKAGVDVAAVLDTAPFSGKARGMPGMMAGGTALIKGLYYLVRLAAAGVMIKSGIGPLAVEGTDDRRVRAVRYKTSGGKVDAVACDSVGLGFGLRAETQLADLLELPFNFDRSLRQWLPSIDPWGRSSMAGIHLAGDGVQLAGAQAAELSGIRAAEAVLHDIGHHDASRAMRSLNRRLARWHRFRDAMTEMAFPFPHRLAQECDDGLMICRCEGIAAGAIRDAVRSLGQTEINRVKAFTRVGMGRCQGRVCQAAAAEIMASTGNLDISSVSRFRGQAPIKPLPMAAFREGTAQ